MSLPKLSQPVFTLTIPSTKKKIRYRPFTVKEEKLLMIAQASGEREGYINVFKQLITNCCIDEIDIDTLASYDIEYFFLCLRAKSVSNVIKLKVTDDHGKEVEVEVNLDEVKVHEPTVPNKIVLDEERNLGIKLKYPTFTELTAIAKKEEGEASLEDGLDLFISLIELIWEGESVFMAKDCTREELVEFVEDFNSTQVEQVENFMQDLPYVYIDVSYTDSQGLLVSDRVSGIESFFV